MTFINLYRMAVQNRSNNVYLQLSRSRQAGQTLVDQIVWTIANALEQQTYPADTALPSVRRLAKSQGRALILSW